MADRYRPSPLASRRRFLAGAAASGLLAACGSGGSGNGGESGSGDGASPLDEVPVDDLSVLRFFGPFYAAGEVGRIPFGISDSEGLLPAESLPGNVTISVTNPEREVVAEGLTAVLRDGGLPRAYYSFEFTPAMIGFYDFAIDVGDDEIVSQFQVVDPDAAEVAARVGPGDLMPSLETPTVDDPRGVTPVCTRDPMCDLHQSTVAELAGSEPMALLVATPAFCQTIICGPVLDILLGVIPDYPDISFVHAEVFRDPAQNGNPIGIEDFAPVITDLGLPYEPALFTVDANGVVRDRVDYIFDEADIRATLDEVVV